MCHLCFIGVNGLTLESRVMFTPDLRTELRPLTYIQHSHWSSSYIALISLVEMSFAVSQLTLPLPLPLPLDLIITY